MLLSEEYGVDVTLVKGERRIRSALWNNLPFSK